MHIRFSISHFMEKKNKQNIETQISVFHKDL